MKQSEKKYKKSPQKIFKEKKLYAVQLWDVLASPRWVTVDKSGEMQYRIVAPMLSSSGDYTPVYALIATSKVSNHFRNFLPVLLQPASGNGSGYVPCLTIKNIKGLT